MKFYIKTQNTTHGVFTTKDGRRPMATFNTLEEARQFVQSTCHANPWVDMVDGVLLEEWGFEINTEDGDDGNIC